MSKLRGSMLVLLAVLVAGVGSSNIRAEDTTSGSADPGAPLNASAADAVASEFPLAPPTDSMEAGAAMLPNTEGQQFLSGVAGTQAPQVSPQTPLPMAPSQVAMGPPAQAMTMLPAPAPYMAAPAPYMAAPAPYMAAQAPYMAAQAPYMAAQAPYVAAQAPYGYGPGMPMMSPGMGYGVQSASYMDDPTVPQPFSPGAMSPVPAGYTPDKMIGGCGDPNCSECGAGGYGCGIGGGGGFCSYCGGGGCPYCVGGGMTGGYLAKLLGLVLPYSEGGQCAPRWYDITADFVYLRRDNTSRRVDFTTLYVLGNVVLSSEDIDFGNEGAFRLTGAAQFFAGGNIEFTYLGLGNWAADASVSDPSGELFSVISDYGIDPPASITDPYAGFDQTDAAIFHSIAYSSSIDSFELHYRHRWTGPNCRLQGSWLAGVRYVYLMEDFDHNTIGGTTPGETVPRGEMNYSVRTHNSLTGAQFGGDLWTTVIPGIKFGGEAKAGIYGNYAQQSTEIASYDSSSPVANVYYRSEHEQDSDVGLVGEASLQLIYRTSPNWSIRGGYSFVYLNGVALAIENFDGSSPPWLTRSSTINHNGNVLLHGFQLGFEWMW